MSEEQLELFQKIGEEIYKSNFRKEAAEKALSAVEYFESLGMTNTEEIKVVK